MNRKKKSNSSITLPESALQCLAQLGLISFLSPPTSTSRRSFGHKAPGWLESNWRKLHSARAYYQTLPKALSKGRPLGWSSLVCQPCHSQKASPWTLFCRKGVLYLKRPPKDPHTAPGCWGQWHPSTRSRSTTWVGVLKWNLLRSTPRVVSPHCRISMGESSPKVSHDSVEAKWKRHFSFLGDDYRFPDLPSWFVALGCISSQLSNLVE